MAERYLKERISLNPRKSVMWYDYALFCLRAEDPGKAEEALRECLGLNLDDQLSLMACGAVLCEREQYMEAEVLLQSAVDASPVQPRMAWALLVCVVVDILLHSPFLMVHVLVSTFFSHSHTTNGT